MVRFHILQLDAGTEKWLGYAKQQVRRVLAGSVNDFTRTWVVGDGTTIRARCHHGLLGDETVKLWISGVGRFRYFLQLGAHIPSYKTRRGAASTFNTGSDAFAIPRLTFLERFLSDHISLARDYAIAGMYVTLEDGSLAQTGSVVKIDAGLRLVWMTAGAGVWAALSFEDATNTPLVVTGDLPASSTSTYFNVPVAKITVRVNVTITGNTAVAMSIPASDDTGAFYDAANLQVSIAKKDETTNTITLTYEPQYLSTPIRASQLSKNWVNQIPLSVAGNTWGLSQYNLLVPKINNESMPVFLVSHRQSTALSQDDEEFTMDETGALAPIAFGDSVTSIHVISPPSFSPFADVPQTMPFNIGFNTIRGGSTASSNFAYHTYSVNDYTETWDFPLGLTVRIPKQPYTSGRARYEIVYESLVIRAGYDSPTALRGQGGSGSHVADFLDGGGSFNEEIIVAGISGPGLTCDEDFDAVRAGPTQLGGGVPLDVSAAIRAPTISRPFGKLCVVTQFSAQAGESGVIFALLPKAWDAATMRPLILKQAEPVDSIDALIAYINATAKLEFLDDVHALDGKIAALTTLRNRKELNRYTSEFADRCRIALNGRHNEKNPDGTPLDDINGIYDIFAGEVISPLPQEKRAFTLDDSLVLFLGPGDWIYV